MTRPNFPAGALYLAAAALCFSGVEWSAWLFIPAALATLAPRQLGRRRGRSDAQINP
jgi:hypothetical protein